MIRRTFFGLHTMKTAKKPTSYALILAGTYAFVAGAYIFVSSTLAASMAASIDELQHVELLKGGAFVFVTAPLLFLLSYNLFGRATRASRAVAESEEALRTSHRRATIGLFAASVAHDLNNVLSVMRYGVDQLQDVPDGVDSNLVEEMSHAVERASELATSLMQVGSSDTADTPEQFDFAEELSTALVTLKLHAEVRKRDLTLDARDAMPFRGHRTMIHQLVVNLVLNAVEATEPGGIVRVNLREISDGVVLEVHDDGPGIPEEDREDLFGPFFTTKVNGTGLGLLSARACAQHHDGTIEIDDSPLGGACIRVILHEQ